MFKVILLLIACLFVSTIAFSTRPFGVIRKTSISMAIDAFGRPVRASAAPAPAPVKATPVKATPTKATPTKAAAKPAAAPVKKAVVASKPVASKPAASVAKASPVASLRPGSKSASVPKKDMTWGGRPDPTPELVVDEKADFWYFLKGKK